MALQGCITTIGLCWCVLLRLVNSPPINRSTQSMDLTSALAIYLSVDLVDPPRECIEAAEDKFGMQDNLTAMP